MRLSECVSGALALTFVTALGAQTATVTGSVTMGGAPVKGALVGVVGADTAVITDRAGAFSIAGLRPGADTLVVEHLGSDQIRVPVQLDAGGTRSVPIAVGLPTAIDTATIAAARLKSAYGSVGFETRRASGNGTFLDQGQIAKRSVNDVADLLRTAPGFRVTYVGGRSIVQATRGSTKCVVYYVDRIRYHPLHIGDIGDVVRPREIAALEAYPGIAPAQFGNHQGCATVVIWTKTRLGT
jgi:carboxypeptidase family protein